MPFDFACAERKKVVNVIIFLWNDFFRVQLSIDCINQISSVVVTRKMQEKTKNIYVNSPWHLHQQTKCFNFTDFHYNTNAHFRENAELQQAINVEMAQVY